MECPAHLGCEIGLSFAVLGFRDGVLGLRVQSPGFSRFSVYRVP